MDSFPRILYVSYIKLTLLQVTSILRLFKVQLGNVRDEVLWSCLFCAVVELRDVFSHDVVETLASWLVLTSF